MLLYLARRGCACESGAMVSARELAELLFSAEARGVRHRKHDAKRALEKALASDRPPGARRCACAARIAARLRCRRDYACAARPCAALLGREEARRWFDEAAGADAHAAEGATLVGAKNAARGAPPASARARLVQQLTILPSSHCHQVAFFARTGLPRAALARIWSLAKSPAGARGRMAYSEFAAALRLAALAQRDEALLGSRSLTRDAIDGRLALRPHVESSAQPRDAPLAPPPPAPSSPRTPLASHLSQWCVASRPRPAAAARLTAAACSASAAQGDSADASAGRAAERPEPDELASARRWHLLACSDSAA